MDYQLTLNWPDFIERYWQKRPVVLKRGFANFIDPLSPDELAGLAMESEVDSRLVSHQDGKWQVSHGPFESYDHLSENNWSLLVQAVNHWHEPSAALMHPFRALPDWRIDDLMISFSVPGGGVGPHLDQYDVFIIQGTGRRRWRVGEKVPMKQHCPHPDLLQVDPFEAIIDEEMEPGDILYIPPGFPHEGYSLENSLNYSVGYRAPNARELFSGFADYVLQRELGSQRYADPDVPSRDHPADILPTELDRLREMMLGLINQPEHFKQWFGEFITQSRHELDVAPPEPPYQPDEIYDALQQGDTLERLGGLRVLRIDGEVFVNGEKINSPHRPALDALATHLTLRADHFWRCAGRSFFPRHAGSAGQQRLLVLWRLSHHPARRRCACRAYGFRGHRLDRRPDKAKPPSGILSDTRPYRAA
ncbi:putative enzyme [Klebsiella pneumoniae]|uniref:Putative enzyme n=19 Tax=Gammaproteobacteria TaxID=1236 RepID=A0A2X3F0V8_KLEPN|nr:putative enzyme [Klebsiella pneumoniae]